MKTNPYNPHGVGRSTIVRIEHEKQIKKLDDPVMIDLILGKSAHHKEMMRYNKISKRIRAALR
jgi:hypothetical protein